MVLKPKHAYYCIVGILGALAWFNIFSWPHDSKAAISLLNKIDELIFRPTAHPTMFAIVVGVAFGTIIIPEAWRVTRTHFFPGKPKADMDMRDVFTHLRMRSKWGIGRKYENQTLPNGNIRFFEEDVEIEIRNAARQGRIKVWGQPKDGGLLDATQREIKPEVWEEIAFDLAACNMSPNPGGCCTTKQSFSTNLHFDKLYANRAEVLHEWPRASYPRLWMDGTWKSRKSQPRD